MMVTNQVKINDDQEIDKDGLFTHVMRLHHILHSHYPKIMSPNNKGKHIRDYWTPQNKLDRWRYFYNREGLLPKSQDEYIMKRYKLQGGSNRGRERIVF